MLTSSKSSQASSSSSSPFSCTTMLSNPSLDHRFHDEEQIYNLEENQPLLLTHDQHQAEYTFVSRGGSYDHSTLVHESDKYGLKLLPIRKRRVPTNNEDCYQSYDHNNTIENGSSKKWMSSKMRLMQKMMMGNGSNDRKRGANNEMDTSPVYHHVGDDHKKLNSSSNFENPIRVCSDCNTTKTPLWRGGPSGPKTLCNACGIRQRKARRAMVEAAASNGTVISATTTSSHHAKTTVVVQQKYKKKRSNKLCVPSTNTSQKLGFEDFMLSLRENCSSFQRVFPQDEKEAAILLMALSHGLVL